MKQGKIIKGVAGFYYVDIQDEGIYECKAKGIFRKKNIVPLIGDEVKMDVRDVEKKVGNVVEILPRKNQLIRPTVSNVDQAIIVFAVKDPAPNYSLLDRFLILAAEQDIDVTICFNKIDLIKQDELEKMTAIYKKAGYNVLATSAINERNEELIEVLKGKTTVFAGPSGVGKSSILNMVKPNLKLQTGEISDKIKRGKHTTRHAELIRLGEGSYVVDTPGFSSLYLHHISYEDLSNYYREFGEYSQYCKFTRCSHIHEPKCGIKQAVEEGNISQKRYDSYILLYNEIKEHEERNKWR